MFEPFYEAPGPDVPPWPFRYVSSAGLRVAHIDYGPTDPGVKPAIPLLLLHGAQGNWSHWRANIEWLAKRRRVLVPDMPGFGRSETMERGGLPELARTISALVQALDIEQVDLVAYSFGSLVGTQVASTAPDLVRRLLLINPPGWLERSPEVVDIQVQAAKLNKQHGLRAGVKHTLQELMLLNHEHIDSACLDAAETAVRDMRLRTKEISRSADLVQLLTSVSCRWHVAFSDQDPYHRYQLAERRTRLMGLGGQGCTTVIRGARHWAQQDRPAEVNMLVDLFSALEEAVGCLPDEI